jgi:hypothetical protein
LTDFKSELRHYCRNPKCRSKLPAPISNPREAFCIKGCCERFYRLRCYVCEEKKTGRLDAHTCGRRKCKNAMRSLRRPSDTGCVEIGVGESIESGVRKPLKPDRAWRIVAGPELTPNKLHCATIPDGPNCRWEGGAYQRIEAKNRADLEAHAQAEIEANGYFTEPQWREFISPDAFERYHGKSWVTCFKRSAASPPMPTPAQYLIPDDLSIPDFLRRPLPQPERDSDSDRRVDFDAGAEPVRSADRLAA